MILAGQHLVALGAGFDPERRLDFPGSSLLFEFQNSVLLVLAEKPVNPSSRALADVGHVHGQVRGPPESRAQQRIWRRGTRLASPPHLQRLRTRRNRLHLIRLGAAR